MESDRLLTVALLGAGGWAAYEFAYKPWRVREELRRTTEAAMSQNLKKGMSLTDAAAGAVGGACMAAAAAYAVPPSLSSGVCQGVGIIATKGAIAAAKGAAVAGKAVGKATVAATKAVGKATTTAVKAVGTGVKTAVYTAPKKAVTTAAKTVKKAACLGIFCGLEGLDAGEFAEEVDRILERSPSPNPFASVARARAPIGAARTAARLGARRARRPIRAGSFYDRALQGAA